MYFPMNWPGAWGCQVLSRTSAAVPNLELRLACPSTILWAAPPLPRPTFLLARRFICSLLRLMIGGFFCSFCRESIACVERCYIILRGSGAHDGRLPGLALCNEEVLPSGGIPARRSAGRMAKKPLRGGIVSLQVQCTVQDRDRQR